MKKLHTLIEVTFDVPNDVVKNINRQIKTGEEFDYDVILNSSNQLMLVDQNKATIRSSVKKVEVVDFHS